MSHRILGSPVPRIGSLCPHTFPVSPRWQSLGLTFPGCRSGHVASGPEASVPRAPTHRAPETGPRSPSTLASEPGVRTTASLPLASASSARPLTSAPRTRLARPLRKPARGASDGRDVPPPAPRLTFAPDGPCSGARFAEQNPRWVPPPSTVTKSPSAQNLCLRTARWCGAGSPRGSQHSGGQASLVAPQHPVNPAPPEHGPGPPGLDPSVWLGRGETETPRSPGPAGAEHSHFPHHVGLPAWGSTHPRGRPLCGGAPGSRMAGTRVSPGCPHSQTPRRPPTWGPCFLGQGQGCVFVHQKPPS